MAAQPFQPSRRPWSVGVANYLNLQTFPRHANQVIATAAVYEALFEFGAAPISRWLAPKTYRGLSSKTRISWNIRFVAFLQSIFISGAALKVILTDPTRINTGPLDRLWAYSTQAGSVQAYAAGYFLYDIYVSFRHMHASGPSSAVHAVCAFIVTMLGFRPFANYYGVNFVLYELSTPFLHIHWWLDKLGKTGSDLQLYNGLGLMATFFGCRLVWGTYQTWLLSKDMLFAWRNRGSGAFPTWLFSLYFVSNTMLTCLNFHWFGKMVEALRKRFDTPPETKPETSQ